ncbi:3-hydroxyisobutyryl-CoA hydrolase, mitochondrial [Orchesella cincta]|uniref:3-hydroxyisobutyryl-CoA hydrolase, mitochondrial n=1 Tax=Orchesella cincta TaxID=48709 RepID=A0A1D2NMR4_ORCCI|nr:3-hydroxyisobutyryl-CoA hydrolase, mitochondrial [Orchesella cincta]
MLSNRHLMSPLLRCFNIGGGYSVTFIPKLCSSLGAVSSRTMSSTTQPLSQSTKSNPVDEEDTLFEIINGKGVITLNRPKALNALNLSMVRKIYQKLKEWESSNTQFVLIKGSGGKAFCAGGDIRAVTESAKAGTTLYQEFFKEEYQVNNLVGTLRIPYVALIDGITMGGGVGLSVHGLFRVATEKTLFAMPETGIGLFPDVGGGYFLPRLGGKLGLYLALTGHRLKGADVFRSGVATHMCNTSMLPALEQDLISLNSSKPQDIEQVLNRYHSQCPESQKPFGLEDKMDEINKTFDAASVEGILQNLKNNGSEWALKTIETLSKMSPTSMKITLKLLEVGSEMELQECLGVEYRLSQRCSEDHDFKEGVRALLVDKDQSPKWNPSTLEGVTPDIVEKYFSPLPAGRDLKL